MTNEKKEPFEGVGIHISSDPDRTTITRAETSDAVHRARLPFRILLAGDLLPQAVPEDWSEDSRVSSVDRNSFADLLEQWAPSLGVEVANHLGTEPRSIDVDLTFRKLADFEPSSLILQIPALSRLSEVRQAVSEARHGAIDADAFAARIEDLAVSADWATDLFKAIRSRASKPTPRPQGGAADSSADSIDRLLGMVDLGDEAQAGDAVAPPPKSRSTLDSLMAAVTGSSEKTSAVDKSLADSLLADLDDSMARQLRAVVDHPDLRHLESSWRGLKLLVDQLDFRTDLTLEVLASPKNELEGALYHQVLLPEHASTTGIPLSLIVLDYEFDNGSRDVEILTDIAETAESLQVPTLGSVSPGFFGLRDPKELGRLPVLWQLLEQPEYIGWHKLRNESGSSFVSLVVPPVNLRERFAMDGAGSVELGPLLGRASVAAAALLGQRYGATGWPTNPTGRENAEIEGFATCQVGGGALPLSAAIPTEKLGELDSQGFGSLGAMLNRDAVFLAFLPTIQAAPKNDEAEEPAMQARLETQLFASRMAHFLLLEQGTSEAGLSVEESLGRLTARIVSFLGLSKSDDTSAYVSATLMPELDTPDAAAVAVTVSAPPPVLPYQVRVTFGYTIPKVG